MQRDASFWSPMVRKVLIRFPFRTLFDYFSFAVMAPGGTKIKILKPSCIKPGYYFKTWRRLLQESHLGLQPPGRRSLKAKTRCMSKVFFRPPPVWRCFLSAPFLLFSSFSFLAFASQGDSFLVKWRAQSRVPP